MRCTRLAGNIQDTKMTQKSPSAHHRTTLLIWIVATKARINNRKKNLLSSNISSTCPHNMVNFGPLTAGIGSGVWGIPANFNGFASFKFILRPSLAFSYIGSVTARHSTSGRQPNFAALSRGRHLYSTERPSRWTLVHILVWYYHEAASQYYVRKCGLLLPTE